LLPPPSVAPPVSLLVKTAPSPPLVEVLERERPPDKEGALAEEREDRAVL
jgi:hypothetical protein